MRGSKLVHAAALLVLALSSRPARAQDPADFPPPQGDQPVSTRGIDLLQKRAYWAHSAAPRPFVSAVLEAGILYYRPNIALGYGRPHSSWIGVEAYPSLTTSGGAGYVGLRAALPALEVRAGARYVFSVDQYFLPPQDSYTRDDTETEIGPPSRYVTGEIEIAGSAPLLGGSVFGVVGGYLVLGVPGDFYVYEEAYHAVINPPLLWRARLGYLGALDRYGDLRLGAAAEIIGNPARDAAIVRLGPVVSVSLTHHLDALGAVMIVAASPDTLGLLGADLGQLGLRYRWATGDRWPEFP